MYGTPALPRDRQARPIFASHEFIPIPKRPVHWTRAGSPAIMSSRLLRYGWWLLALAPAVVFVWPARADDPTPPAPGAPTAGAKPPGPAAEAPKPDAATHGRVSALSGKLMLRGKDDEDYS